MAEACTNSGQHVLVKMCSKGLQREVVGVEDNNALKNRFGVWTDAVDTDFDCWPYAFV